MNEAGTVYYYVVSAANPTEPTPAELKAQTNTYGTGGSVTVAAKGSEAAAADTEVVVDLSGFSDNEVLSIFVVAEDDETTPNIQGAVTDLDLTMADDTAPSFATGFPMATSISGGDLDLLVKLDEPGKFHYAILPTGSAAPTAAEIQAGTNSNAVACSPTAGVAVLSSTSSVTVSITSTSDYATCSASATLACHECPNLSSETTYDVYVLAQDDNSASGAGRSNNVQSVGSPLTLVTADVTAPAFDPDDETYPSTTNVGVDSATIGVALDEIGTAYFLVVANASTAPTASQVKTQGDSYTPSGETAVTVVKKGTISATTASTEFTASVTGLDDLTAYSVYVVMEDQGNTDTSTNVYATTAPNLAATPSRAWFTTADGTPPEFTGEHTPGISSVAGVSFDIDVALDEPGKVYYVVVNRTTDDPPGTPPTVSEVKAGTYAGTTACGEISVTAADTNATASVSTTADPDNNSNCSPADCSLCPIVLSESRYWVYIVAEDDETTANVQTTTTRLAVTTTDVTPPAFTDEGSGEVSVTSNERPADAAVGDDTISITVATSLDEPGVVYYLAALDTVTAPTPAQIKACGATRDGAASEVNGYTYTPSGGSATDVIACGRKIHSAANTVESYVLSGIPPETDVRVFVAAQDFEDQRVPYPGLDVNPPTANLQSASDPVLYVDVTTADISPPAFAVVSSVQYPVVLYAADGDITDDDAKMNVALDEPGDVYYVVVPRDYTYHELYTDGSRRSVPTVAEVKAGTGPGGSGEVDSGTVSVTTADTVVEIQTTAAALSSETAYDVYLVAQDKTTPTPNAQTSVTKLQFTTRDATAPTFATDYPKSYQGGVAVEVVVKLDEPGRAYFVVVARGATAPTSAEVVAGADYGGVTVVAECGSTAGDFDVPNGGEDRSCSVAGLTEATDYDVYVVAVDEVSDDPLAGKAFPDANVMASPAKLEITTADVTPPTHDASYPAVDNLAGTSFDLKIKLSEAGSAYYVVDLLDAAEPSAANVKMGVSSVGGAVAASGTVAVASTAEVTATVQNQQLASETAYSLYVAAEDDETTPNLETSVNRVNFTTPDITPPKFVGHYTAEGAVDAVTGSGFNLTVQLDEPGTTYYVVVAKGESQSITAADVRNLRGGAVGTQRTVVACGAWHQTEANANFTVVVETNTDASCASAGFTTGDNIPAGSGVPALPASGSMTDAPECYSCPKLESGTEYDVYIVAEDDGGHAVPTSAYVDAVNLQTSPTRVLIAGAPSSAASVTTADVTAPAWTNDAPYAANFYGDGFDIAVALDEPGVVHYAVVVENATCSDADTHATVLAGTDGCGSTANKRAHGSISVPAANTVVNHTVHGLGSATRFADEYVVILFAEDDEPSGMSSLTSPNRGAVTSFKNSTTDTLAPLFADGYPKADTPVSRTGFGALTTTFTVRVEADEAGTAYYVAFPASDASAANVGTGAPGSRPPTAAQVVAGKDYNGDAAAVSGSFAVSAAATEASATTTHALTDATTYNVYVVMADDASSDARTANPTDNVSPVVALQVTTSDGTAPLFSGNPCASQLDEECPSALHSLTYEHSRFPKLSNCAPDGFDVEVSVDEDGSVVHYMVVAYADLTALAASSDPTMEEVSLGAAYTPALTSALVTPVAAGTIPSTGTLAAGEAVTATVSMTAQTGFYQVFVVTEGPNGNLGDGDARRTTKENPTKLAPCLVPQSDSSDDYYQKTMSWTTGDTTLTAKAFLTAPATVHYVLLRSGSPAPNPTQVLEGKDSALATPPCQDYVNPDGDDWLDVRCYFADNSKTDTAGSTVCGSAGSTLWDDDTPCDVATFTNLTRGETYDLYTVTTHVNGTVLTDSTGPDGASTFYAEFSRVVTKDTIRTTDTQAPFFLPSYPKLADIRGDSAVLVAQLDEPGTMYYVILDAATATTPTAAQVKAGTDASDDAAAPVASGSVSAATVNSPNPNYAPYKVSVTGLSPRTQYVLYVVAEDDEATPNLQSAPAVKPFTTGSSDATLSALVAATAGGAIEVRPSLKTSVSTYHTVVGVSESTVLITATANDTQSADKIFVNGTQRASGTQFSQTVAHGRTVFEIVVVAGDGVTERTYHLAVTRAVDDTVTNATLALLDLTFDDGTKLNSTQMGGASWPRCVKGCDANSRARCSAANPDCIIDSTVTKYAARIPARVDKVTITATPARSGASVRLYTHGNQGTEYPGGLPGYTSGKDLAGNEVIDLRTLAAYAGDRIEVVVTAADGVTKQVHVIHIERYGVGVYGEGWTPPSASVPGARYGEDDALTTRVGVDPTVRDLTVIKTLDATAPGWIPSYPRTTSPSSGALEMVVQLDEPGTVYYCVLPNDARAPTSREVKEAAALREDAVKAGTITSLRSLTQETVVEVSGLTASTAYDVWFVAEDDAKDHSLAPRPNLQATPVSVDVTTAA